MTQIRVDVYDKYEYTTEDWPPTDAVGFICWFQSKLESVPQEFRDDVKIKLHAFPSYDDSAESNIEIYYYRDETPEDILKRQAKERALKKQQEISELVTLAKLKAKYGE